MCKRYSIKLPFFHHALKSPPFSLVQSKLNSKTMKTLSIFRAFLTLASALQNKAAQKKNIKKYALIFESSNLEYCN